MNIRKEYAKACLFLGIVGMSFLSSLQAQPVIPVPKKMEQGTGSFLFSEKTWIYTNTNGEEAQLLEECLRTLSIPLKQKRKKATRRVSVSDKGVRGAISLLLTEDCGQLPSPESYLLSVTPEKIIVRATSGAGLFYGIQTLAQLLECSEDSLFSIPSVEIEDTPRFSYRGVMLDVSRHFFSKEFVKKQIDALSFYKMNRLHLHLTDAAGWRIEIKKYPLLTDFAAWRTDANWKKWWNGNRKYLYSGDPGASGGYYTQEDIREIVDYARRHFITVIPEIEMPAHSEEVLSAYPQLSCSGEPYKNADFCIGNEATFSFLEDVLTEIMELFPSEYIHVGGDEAGMAAWKECPKCRKRMEEEHLSHVEELQSYLIRRMEKFLNAHGRRLLGWDEILKGGLAPDATVMSWRGEEGGLAAVASGHQAIMTPGEFCYLDSYQDAPYSQPEAIGGYLPLEKVYSYQPIPASLSAKEAQRVLGVQGNLWAEYIPTSQQMEYMMYPRVLALAEVAWSVPERKSWEDFHARALKAVNTLRSKGYHPFDLENEIGHRPESLQPVKHLALGKKVIYNAPYNSSYAAKGEATLTDGFRGDWTYSDGAWQGFISKDRLDVTVDMENTVTLHSVSAAFMQVVGAEVYLPESVIISVSEDGIQFTELMSCHYAVCKEEANKITERGWNGTATGRYIRYQARSDKKLGGWIFTDEIVVK